MINQAQPYLESNWFQSFVPGLILTLLVLPSASSATASAML